MPDFDRPRHTLKVAAECDDIQANNAAWFIHPIDPDTGAELEQPSQEKIDELTRDIDTFERWAGFYREIAPDVPRDGN